MPRVSRRNPSLTYFFSISPKHLIRSRMLDCYWKQPTMVWQVTNLAGLSSSWQEDTRKLSSPKASPEILGCLQMIADMGSIQRRKWNCPSFPIPEMELIILKKELELINFKFEFPTKKHLIHKLFYHFIF